MKDLLKGDTTLWCMMFALSIGSVVLVYSASSNLAFVVRTGTTTAHMMKHFFLLLIGLFVIAPLVGRIRGEYIYGLSKIGLFLSWILLIYASFMGGEIGGADASRWIRIAGFSFQPSVFVYTFFVVYLCKFISRADYSWRGWWHLLLILLLILPFIVRSNGSMGLIVFVSTIVILLLGCYPLKKIMALLGVFTFLGALFVAFALFTPMGKSTRVHTWMSRVSNFTDYKKEENLGKNYQIIQSRAAIVHGGLTGRGPGKSVLKQTLPQSSSDFIFSIVVEEFGSLGAFILLFIYGIILVRSGVIAHNAPSVFDALLAVAMGVVLFVQIGVNLGVNLAWIPVTGQPLPLVSSGGTAIWATFIQLGLLLNISQRTKDLAISKKNKEAEKVALI